MQNFGRAFCLLLGAARLSSSVYGDLPVGVRIARSARTQVGVTLSYDPDYRRVAYPGGDVPPERGVCTDVVIRALRSGAGIDLQRLVHEDMARNFSKYPRKWGRRSPDPNIVGYPICKSSFIVAAGTSLAGLRTSLATL